MVVTKAGWWGKWGNIVPKVQTSSYKVNTFWASNDNMVIIVNNTALCTRVELKCSLHEKTTGHDVRRWSRYRRYGGVCSITRLQRTRVSSQRVGHRATGTYTMFYVNCISVKLGKTKDT